MTNTNLLGTSAIDLVRSMPGRTAPELAALAGIKPDTEEGEQRFSAFMDELCALLWETKVVCGPKRACRTTQKTLPVWYAIDEELGEV